jgi:hypothetical protein
MPGIVGSTQLTTPKNEVVSAYPCCPLQLAVRRSAVKAGSCSYSKVNGAQTLPKLFGLRRRFFALG